MENLIRTKMNKKAFENLMILVIAAILLLVSYLDREEYSPITLLPLIKMNF